MARSIAQKRIVKDIQLLENNKDELHNRGIYWHVDEKNMHNIWFLVIPKHKQDNELVSPYTGGFFVFKLSIPDEFPIEPPKIEFYPQQSMCRLHPNYYQNGKICLSVVNSWGEPDWTPSMSLMSLANILEERLNEQSMRFEPGFEKLDRSKIKDSNMCIEYAVLYVAVLDVLLGKYKEYDVFKDVIHAYWMQNKNAYIERLQKHAAEIPVKQVKQLLYAHSYVINYPGLLQKFESAEALFPTELC